MAQQPGLHIDRWFSGLYTNRAATNTPFRYSYGRPIEYHDALIDGSNVEITTSNTLARRPGYAKLNASNTLTGGEVATGLYSAIMNGTLYDFLDTTQNVYTFSSSSLTSIYTKTTTAQTRYQQVGNRVYFSDGATNKKVEIESNGTVSVTNAGIAAPTVAPSIPNLNALIAATQTIHGWVPGVSYSGGASTPNNFYLLAPTGELYWAVVPAGTTLTSAQTQPNWAAAQGTFGAAVIDGTMVWTNSGTPAAWAASTLYTNKTYILTNGLSAANTSEVVAGSGSGVFANWTLTGNAWGCVNSSGHTGVTNTLKITNLGFAVPTGSTISGVTVTLFRGANRANAVQDSTVQLLKAGVAAGSNKATTGFWPQILWSNYNIPTTGGIKQQYGSNTDLWGTTLAPADVNNAGFGIEIIANQTSSSTTSFGLTPDANNNNVIADFVVYYTISSAAISGQYFAQVVLDSNGNLQIASVGGTSGTSAPAWSTTINGTTTDNTVTWLNLGTGTQLPCLFQRTYAYGYHSSGAVNHTSTLSPTVTLYGPLLGVNVPVTCTASSDTQVDRLDLYRTLDGGGLLLYDTSGPNVPGNTTTITDIALDSALNFLLIGPVAHQNDPPPAGITNLTFYQGRLWGFVGNLLYFSGGPDTANGDGVQAWPPANVFTLPSAGIGFAPTSVGLVVVTNDSIFTVMGGPQTLSYWVQPVKDNFGILSPNCIAQDGDDVVMYTTQRKLYSMSPSDSNEISHNVAQTIRANFDPNVSYLTIHRNGEDQGIFLSNGSTNVIRYNMNTESWDPLQVPASGIGPIKSISTVIGTRRLVSVAGTFIINRDPTTFADSGVAYSAFATVGSLVLSEPGEPMAIVKSLLLTSAAVGSGLTISVMPNEIGTPGVFTIIPNPVPDPWPLPPSQSITMNRYDWKANQAAIPQQVKHLQIKIQLPSSDTVKNEIYTLAIIAETP